MAELDGDADVLEHPHGAPAEVVRGAAGHVVEEAGGVDRDRLPVRAELRRLEQIELDLGVRVEREPAIGGLRERPLEDVPRVGRRRLAVRVMTSQNIRAVGSTSPRQGRIWNVVGSGNASMVAS